LVTPHPHNQSPPYRERRNEPPDAPRLRFLHTFLWFLVGVPGFTVSSLVCLRVFLRSFFFVFFFFFFFSFFFFFCPPTSLPLVCYMEVTPRAPAHGMCNRPLFFAFSFPHFSSPGSDPRLFYGRGFSFFEFLKCRLLLSLSSLDTPLVLCSCMFFTYILFPLLRTPPPHSLPSPPQVSFSSVTALQL